jgi:hypothetical protein
MGKNHVRPGAFFVGLYAWLAAMFFGAIVFDIAYSRFAPYRAAAFSDAADFLLLIGFVTFLAGLFAIAFSWKSKFARTLFIASLLAFSFEIIIPIFFSQLFANVQINDVGPWLRITPVGLASILAFFGIYNFFFHQN